MKALNIELFISKARKLHGEAYDYSKVVYVNNKHPVIITCVKHGDFLQIPNSHLLGKGCPKCKKCYRPTNEEFIERAIILHKGKYTYSKTSYSKANKKVEITCPTHGRFSQTPAMHLSGRGCPRCATNFKKSTKFFVEKAGKVHGELYDYSKSSYIGSHLKVTIGCPKHGDFSQTPAMHLSGNGCPKCKLSNGELKIWLWLFKNKYAFIPQKTFSDCVNPKTSFRLKFDFYLPAEKILIEYNGEQHFGHGHLVGGKHQTTPAEYSEICYRDQIKRAYAKAKGFHLLCISYKDYDKVEAILSESIC